MARRTTTFYKMHSLGNDFMVLDRVTQPLQLDAATIAAWGDRKTGIGFDQLLIIDPPTEANADFYFRIYNADGSSAEQCGNGTRCVALLARHLELTKKAKLTWQSAAGPIQTEFRSPQQIETTMTVPLLAPQQIPFDPSAAGACLGELDAGGHWSVEAAGQSFDLTPVSMGNPHGVIMFDNIFDVDVDRIGAELTAHAVFPEGGNIGFCQVVDRQFMRLRVFERGVGETRACGSVRVPQSWLPACTARWVSASKYRCRAGSCEFHGPVPMSPLQ